jgi:hypothetical protein
MAKLFLALMLLPLTAIAADDVRITYLEQEVRNLQRQVQALTRQLDDVRTRPARLPRDASRQAASPTLAPDDDLPQWVDASAWRSLRAGMSELDVISALGAPNTMREEDGTRVLLYAMEIGSSGFLGGSVRLRDRKVVEITQPSLQ